MSVLLNERGHRLEQLERRPRLVEVARLGGVDLDGQVLDLTGSQPPRFATANVDRVFRLAVDW
jgi:hypothetical protein